MYRLYADGEVVPEEEFRYKEENYSDDYMEIFIPYPLYDYIIESYVGWLGPTDKYL